jgi:hypothetical protein
MKWLWRQATGELLQQIDDNLLSDVIATGYSGMGDGKNNPTMQNVGDVGPIPRGSYRIEDPVDEPSSYTLPLVPGPSNNMYGRSGFLIHGDSLHLPGWASQGCIVLGLAARVKIAQSGVGDLLVVEE